MNARLEDRAINIILWGSLAGILAFTGEDTATGKSWEAWITKKESERRKDIDRAAAEAKSRGHL